MRSFALIILSILCVSLLYGQVNANDKVEWLLVGETNEGDYLLYYDKASIHKDETYMEDRHLFVSVKKEPTAKKIDSLRKEFMEEVKRVEEETKSKIEDTETLFKVFVVKEHTKYFSLEFYCKHEEFKAHDSRIKSMVFNYKIKSGSAEERLKRILCGDN